MADLEKQIAKLEAQIADTQVIINFTEDPAQKKRCATAVARLQARLNDILSVDPHASAA